MDKKELLVRVRPNSGSLYEIYYSGGGNLPKQLSGLYKKPSEADHAINKYLKEKESASNKSKRRSPELPGRSEDGAQPA